MKLVREYEELSKIVIAEDKEIQGYAKELNERLSSLNNFKLNKTILTILIHPIKTMKNSSDLKRLTCIKSKFDEMLEANIVTYIDEETGVLEEDLEYASTSTKPKMLKLFIKRNPIDPK